MRTRPYARLVQVPTTDPAAYNPNRPMSTLLRHQVDALARLEASLPARAWTGVDPATLTTEHHASAYIVHATGRLMSHALEQQAARRIQERRRKARRKGGKGRPARRSARRAARRRPVRRSRKPRRN